MAASKQQCMQNWSAAESSFLIQTLKELNIIARLDGRKTRNSELFKKVHEKLNEAGIDQSVEQIRNRWKTLKTGYYKAKQHNNKSGYDPTNFPFFEPMDEIMGGRPLANVADYGVDVGFEEESCDGESSLNAAPDDAEAGISDDDHNSTEGAEENTEASEDSSSNIADLTVQRAAKKKTKPKSTYERALLTWSSDQQAFMEKMQASQNKWLEQQQERTQQQEERMFSRFLEESSRSNERLIEQLFEGLRAVLPHSSQAASHAFQHTHHPYSQPPYPQPPYPPPQHPYKQLRHPYPQPQPDVSDYTLQNLD